MPSICASRRGWGRDDLRAGGVRERIPFAGPDVHYPHDLEPDEDWSARAQDLRSRPATSDRRA